MKNLSYANRGQPLEQYMQFANDAYKRKGIAFIEKQCTEFLPLRDKNGKIYNVKVEHQATFDFLGRYYNIPIAIEAKNTNSDSIRFDAVQSNQADDMDTFTSYPGTIGLVVVSFSLQRFYAIPWAFWKAAYDARVRPGATRTKPVTVEAFGQTWEVPRKFSTREDELNPLWRVPGNHQNFGLHYLANATSYITPPSTSTK